MSLFMGTVCGIPIYADEAVSSDTAYLIPYRDAAELAQLRAIFGGDHIKEVARRGAKITFKAEP